MALPGPLSMLLDSPVLLDMPWIQLLWTTIECVGPCANGDIPETLLEYICHTWSQMAEERPDEERALFLRDALIIETLGDDPLRAEYFRGMRMRLQVAYAMLEMEALAFGSMRCEYCRCC